MYINLYTYILNLILDHLKINTVNVVQLYNSIIKSKMRTGPKVKAARLPAINPKNTARVPDLALTPQSSISVIQREKNGGRNPVLFVYPLGSTNKSHGPSTIFHGIYQSKWRQIPWRFVFSPPARAPSMTFG